jgi:hypothetical protein
MADELTNWINGADKIDIESFAQRVTLARTARCSRS